jgi:hypothetical protein
VGINKLTYYSNVVPNDNVVTILLALQKTDEEFFEPDNISGV